MAALDPVELLTRALAAGESFSIPQVGTFVQRDGRVELVAGEHRLGDLYLFLGKKFQVADADLPGVAMNLSVDLKSKLAQGPLRIGHVELKLEGDRIALTDHTPQATGLQSIRTADGRAVIPPRPKFRAEPSPSERRAQAEKMAGPMPGSSAAASAGSTSTAPAQHRTSGGGQPVPAPGQEVAADGEVEEMPPVLADIGHGVEEKPKGKVNWMMVSLVTLTVQMLVFMTIIIAYRKEIKAKLRNRDHAVLASTQAPASTTAGATKPATTEPSPVETTVTTPPPGVRDESAPDPVVAKPATTEAPKPEAPKPAAPKPAETKPTATAAPKPTEAKPAPKTTRPAASNGPWRLVIASFPTEGEGRVRLAEWQGRPGWDPQLEQWPDGRWRLSIWRGQTSKAIKTKLTDALAAGAPSDAYAKKWN